MEEKSVEELARQAERKREAGRRLQEQQIKMRLDRVRTVTHGHSHVQSLTFLRAAGATGARLSRVQ